VHDHTDLEDELTFLHNHNEQYWYDRDEQTPTALDTLTSGFLDRATIVNTGGIPKGLGNLLASLTNKLFILVS